MIEEPTINDEITTHPAEHEIFLSFNADEDAVDFYEWWQSLGFAAFAKWAEKERKKREKDSQ